MPINTVPHTCKTISAIEKEKSGKLRATGPVLKIIKHGHQRKPDEWWNAEVCDGWKLQRWQLGIARRIGGLVIFARRFGNVKVLIAAASSISAALPACFELVRVLFIAVGTLPDRLRSHGETVSIGSKYRWSRRGDRQVASPLDFYRIGRFPVQHLVHSAS